MRPSRHLALIVSVALFGASCGGGSRAGSSSTSSLPATGAAATRSALSAYSWARDDAASLSLGGGRSSTLAAVLAPPAPGQDWLIGGTVTAADGSTTATIWRSDDARTWHATDLAGVDGRALAATVWGDRTVVVGSVGQGSARRAAVWLSRGPGEAFTAVADTPALQAPPATGDTSGPVGGASMDVTSAGTIGVFAAGSVSGVQTIWYSTDGTDWIQVTSADHVIDGAHDPDVTSLLVAPDGVYAAGMVEQGTQTEAALWTSADGIHWGTYSAAHNPFLAGGEHRIDGLVMADNLLVAVGAARSGAAWLPASWISPNGVTWSQPSEAFPAAVRPQPSAPGSVVRGLTADATTGTLLAVGGSATVQRVWTSTDGEAWTEIPFPPAAANASDWTADVVATDGPTTVVADSEPGQPHLLVRSAGHWDEVTAGLSTFGSPRTTAEPAALIRDGAGLVLAVDIDTPGDAIGSDRQTAEILSSTDGRAWRVRAQGGPFDGARIDDLTDVAGTLVAVGTRPSPTDGATAVIWTSSGGGRWTTAATFPGSGPGVAGSVPTGQSATTVSSIGRVTVAAGTGPAAGSATAGGGPAAQAWVRTAGQWKAAGSLDRQATLGAQQPEGSCSDGRTLVVVGSADRTATPGSLAPPSSRSHTTTTVATNGTLAGSSGQGDEGSQAATWSTTTGRAWTAGSVTPASGVGSTEAMVGCSAVGSGFVAYGQTAGPDGQQQPAVWQSPDGVSWTLVPLSKIPEPVAAPLSDLAVAGSTWLASSGAGPVSLASPDDPAVVTSDPEIPGADPLSATGPDGEAGLWLSTDAGTTWTRQATGGAPWLAGQELTTDEVAWLGTDAVVAGQVDGTLAVWLGSPSAT